MEIKITGTQLLSLKHFSKHLLNPEVVETPTNEVFADEQYCTTPTINKRLRTLEAEGFLKIVSWKVKEPRPFRRKITVTQKGIYVLMQREPEFMKKMGFDKNGQRKTKR
ncbi:hypothetical protein VPAG_00057 [Vibrio phage douglas 12A4]|uniref:hypothetical protein n=1 Tax=Vibrio phage douglas 12A4 TaxID=573171 RepID=UPI0002C0E931|nr:hypothetical protein VPAG_00057 [Vibrio phage douglas 12A4]AGG58093.1 hypothetical protein VPAG_00057 [Vibrio phage douglas 12A4]